MELKIGKVVSSQVRVSTSENYNVDAQLALDENKGVANVSDGYVRKGDELMATFSSYNEQSVNISFNSFEEMGEVATAIKTYCNAVRQQMPTTPIEF